MPSINLYNSIFTSDLDCIEFLISSGVLSVHKHARSENKLSLSRYTKAETDIGIDVKMSDVENKFGCLKILFFESPQIRLTNYMRVKYCFVMGMTNFRIVVISEVSER